MCSTAPVRRRRARPARRPGPVAVERGADRPRRAVLDIDGRQICGRLPLGAAGMWARSRSSSVDTAIGQLPAGANRLGPESGRPLAPRITRRLIAQFTHTGRSPDTPTRHTPLTSTWKRCAAMSSRPDRGDLPRCGSAGQSACQNPGTPLGRAEGVRRFRASAGDKPDDWPNASQGLRRSIADQVRAEADRQTAAIGWSRNPAVDVSIDLVLVAGSAASTLAARRSRLCLAAWKRSSCLPPRRAGRSPVVGTVASAIAAEADVDGVSRPTALQRVVEADHVRPNGAEHLRQHALELLVRWVVRPQPEHTGRV